MGTSGTVPEGGSTANRRIVHVSLQDPCHTTGGQGVVTLAMARHQLALGRDVEYVSIRLTDESEAQLLEYPEGNLRVHRLEVPDSSMITMPYQGTEQEQARRREEFFESCCRFIRSRYPVETTVVHLHGFYGVPLIAGALSEYVTVTTYHLLLSTRMAQTSRADAGVLDYIRLHEVLSFYGSSRIQAISPGFKEEILDVARAWLKHGSRTEALARAERLSLRVPGLAEASPAQPDLAARIRVIPNAVEEPFFDASIEETDSGLVLAWGRVSPEKGFEHLLQAAARLPRWRFRILGISGEEEAGRRAYRDRLVSLGAGQMNVELDFRADGVRGRELIAEVDRASIVVVPSLYEPFGLVIGEALARGKPVVTTATAGGRFIMGGTKLGRCPHGYLVKQEPHHLADGLTQALTDYAGLPAGERAAMGDAARRRAMTLRWSRVVADLQEHYDSPGVAHVSD
jgi:glycosyltransferase involved in cell wall biosynthesis